MGDVSNLPPLLSGTCLCEFAAMPDGGASIVAVSLPEGETSVIVLRSGDQCLCYRNRCPHFGVELSKPDGPFYVSPHEWLKCNVHYAKFRWDDGVCISGDCVGESLIAVAVVVREGGVWVA